MRSWRPIALRLIPAGQQFVDSRMVGSGSVGEAVSLGQGEPDGSLNFSNVSTSQPRHLLDEGPAPARDDRAEEPADTQAEDDPSATAGLISGKPQAGAVNSP